MAEQQEGTSDLRSRRSKSAAPGDDAVEILTWEEQDAKIEEYVHWQMDMENLFSSTFGFLGLVLALLCLCILVMSVWTPEQLPLVEALKDLHLPPLALHFSLIVYIAVAALNGLSFTGYGVPQLVDVALLISAVPLALWGALFVSTQIFELRLAWLPLGGVVFSGGMKLMHRELREGWLHIGRLRKSMYKHDSA